MEARVRILVGAFDAAEADGPMGEAATEAFFAALSETEFAEPVRRSDPPLTWDRWATERWPHDVMQLASANTVPSTGGLSPAGLGTIRTGGLDAEYVIEGEISRAEEGGEPALRVALIDATNGGRLAVEEASVKVAEELPAATKSIAAKLEAHWVNSALADRVIYLLSGEAGVGPDEVIATLREWMKRWPKASAPALALFAMGTPPRTQMTTKEALELARALREMIAGGDAGALELVRLTGVDPYAALADAAAMSGKQSEALTLHREAARMLPAKAYEHLIGAAQAGIMCRKYPAALEAAGEALKLDPDNGFASLLYGILLDRTGKRAEAAAHLSDFLAAHPEDPAAAQIKEKLDAMQRPKE